MGALERIYNPTKKSVVMFGPADAGKTSLIIQISNYLMWWFMNKNHEISKNEDLDGIYVRLSRHRTATLGLDEVRIHYIRREHGEEKHREIVVYGTGGSEHPDAQRDRKISAENAARGVNDTIFIFELKGIKNEVYRKKIESSIEDVLKYYYYEDTLEQRRYLILMNKAELLYYHYRDRGMIEKLKSKAIDFMRHLFDDLFLDFDEMYNKGKIIISLSSTILGGLEMLPFFEKLRKELEFGGLDVLNQLEQKKSMLDYVTSTDIIKKDLEIGRLVSILQEKDVWSVCKSYIKDSIKASISFLLGDNNTTLVDDRYLIGFLLWLDENLIKKIQKK